MTTQTASKVPQEELSPSLGLSDDNDEQLVEISQEELDRRIKAAHQRHDQNLENWRKETKEWMKAVGLVQIGPSFGLRSL